MNGKTYAFLDLAALPAVGAVLLDRKPAWVFRGDGRALLWSNAAGAAFFGIDTMGGLLERGIGGSNPVAVQIARLSRTLPADATRLEMLRFAFGFSLQTVPAACRRLNLPDGKSAVMAIGNADATRELLPTRAERLVDIIAGEDCLAAIIGEDGRVIGASGGFEKLAPASEAIDALAEAARAGAERIVKRAIKIGGTVHPAGARFDAGGETLALLIVGPADEPETAAVPSPAASTPEKAAPKEEASSTTAVAPAVAAERPAPPRASPSVRFLFETDGKGLITFVSPELARLVGADKAIVAGETWGEAARRLDIDSDGAIAAALAGERAFSGVKLTWPIADRDIGIAAELTAFPLNERGLGAGFRGFGLLHTGDVRQEAPPSPAPAPAEAPPAAATPPVETASPLPDDDEFATLADDLDDAARRSIETGTPPSDGAEAVEATDAELSAAPSAEVVRLPIEPSNVVRMPGAQAPRSKTQERLTGTEQDAFRRIAEALGVQRAGEKAKSASEPVPPPDGAAAPAKPAEAETRILDRLPIAIAVSRGNSTLYANRSFFELLGYDGADDFGAAGGVDAIFPDGPPVLTAPNATNGALSARRKDGSRIAVEARLQTIAWSNAPALLLSLRERIEPAKAPERETPLIDELAAVEARLGELEAILDTATDGVLVFDARGRIGNINRSAEALFGVEAADVLGTPFTDLFAEESRKAALDYLDGIASNGVASVLNDGREVIGKVPQGGLIPLFMTMGRLGRTGKFCAVLRDITHWKNVEEELVASRRSAEAANAQKSEFLAKISHEIRTPLNAIIGFSEVMMEERFGPVENPRYRDYLRDIHVSGSHLMSLINDLLDISKIEAGKLDLSFESVAINEAIQESVALMQPQANRQRIIIRTSLSSGVPNVVADARSLRQILLNLLSNAVKFTEPGGQVIVSTAAEDSGEVVIRIRDTGIGMSEKDIEAALKPFRQLATASRGRGEGTGLGLPLTKALVEANRASFAIDSAVNQGTLVKITFPTTRVLAG